VVHDDKVIGEGWHEHYGHAHAEVNALAQATQTTGKIPSGTTLYVTLEPCNHHGLTPPCTQAIIDAGIEHVVYALRDPNPKAAGGASFLEQSGVSVAGGLLESHARFQNRFFLKHLATGMPFVVAKSASSLDGKIATRTGHSQWITGPMARQRSHQLRQEVDAIIVGADTVIQDNPALTVRLPESLCTEASVRNPRPIILDSKGRVPIDSKLLTNISSYNRPIVATSHLMRDSHRNVLEKSGVEVMVLDANAQGPGVDPNALLKALGRRAIQSVMLEGGASVHGSFRDAGLIDEIWSFLAPMLIGGEQAPVSYAGSGCDTLNQATTLHNVSLETVGDDFLIRALVNPIQGECNDVPYESITSSCLPAVEQTTVANDQYKE
jgi:diaminohydroxyphosphoribosylaminopyrimidine deaminase/5-amino-6-(5-phosphoribosylamino)uracil reductase